MRVPLLLYFNSELFRKMLGQGLKLICYVRLVIVISRLLKCYLKAVLPVKFYRKPRLPEKTQKNPDHGNIIICMCVSVCDAHARVCVCAWASIPSEAMAHFPLF